MNRLFYFTILPVFVLCTGCSSINLRTAGDLAETGSSASSQIAEAYGKRAGDLEIYLEGENILAALNDGYSLPDTDMITKVDAVKAEILQRQEMFNNLLKTYQAFAELAAYDGSSQVETSLRDLTAAVNEYSQLTRNKVFFTKPQEDLAAIAGARLFTAYHQLKVKKASEMIRQCLEAIRELLASQREKAAVTAMETEIDRNRLKAALALWNQGLGLPTEIIAEHIEIYGLEVNRSQTLTQAEKATGGKMRQAIENVMRFRHERQIRSRKLAYDAAIQSVQSLITAHRQFEAGEGFSAEALKNFLKSINEYAAIAGEMKGRQ